MSLTKANDSTDNDNITPHLGLATYQINVGLIKMRKKMPGIHSRSGGVCVERNRINIHSQDCPGLPINWMKGSICAHTLTQSALGVSNIFFVICLEYSLSRRMTRGEKVQRDLGDHVRRSLKGKKK